MHVIRAAALGICFGVRDALATADALLHPARVTIFGQLVHNPLVEQRLAAPRFQFTPESDRSAQAIPTPTALITAHGVSNRDRAALAAAGKNIVDTTCPLVRRAHRVALSLQRQGFYILIIGQPHHVEVRGLVGDLSNYTVVPSPHDVMTYPHPKLGLLCQTTTATEDALAIHHAVREHNPNSQVRFVDTVCQPTKDRQAALARLVSRVDAMVVVGGRQSNNTRRLVERCLNAGRPTFHVESAEDLPIAELTPFSTIGLTAGTSTLPETIDAVEKSLRAI